MLIAQRLQYTNRAEYLLYMWQVEDILRAHDLNIDKLEKEYLSRFELDEQQRDATRTWYEQLIEMMHHEGKQKSGHLRINENVIEGLAEVHDALLRSTKYPYYRELYHRVLPLLVELRAKSGEQLPPAGTAGELSLCFQLLYGVLLLRLQQKEVSSGTAQAAGEVSTFLGQLSDYWKAHREERLDLE
ncbi:MAG: DUF4924 family protein [Bacteroidales bacterium]|nr:DUF4924 family protein [Bacteroidales bacterium]